MEPYLQRHPYIKNRFGFLSSPYLSTIFSRLSTTILTFLEAVEPNLQRHPYVNIRFGFLSSPYIYHHLFPSFYCHFYISQSGGALPPTSPLHQHQTLIPLLPLSTTTFFYTSLPPFYLFLKRSCTTSNVTPTPTSDSDSSPRVTHPRNFSDSTTIFNFFFKR